MLKTTPDMPLPTILLVEDDPNQAADIAEKLAFAGYTIITVDSVEKAKQILLSHGNAIKAIVLDYYLQGSISHPDGPYGIELLQYFSTLPNVTWPPTIGYSSMQDSNEAMLKAGAIMGIHKQYKGDHKTLIQELDKITSQASA